MGNAQGDERMRWFKRNVTVGMVLLLAAMSAFGAERINTLDRTGLFGYKPSGVAIRGYDTVAYFTDGRPTKGLDAFAAEWEGATWKFSSQKNLDIFNGDPAQFAPKFGGYCAYGVAMGNLVKIEPDLWTIVEGKLYLNFDEDVQSSWEEDITGFIKIANGKFEELLSIHE